MRLGETGPPEPNRSDPDASLAQPSRVSLAGHTPRFVCPAHLAPPAFRGAAPHKALIDDPQVLLPIVHFKPVHMGAPGRTHDRHGMRGSGGPSAQTGPTGTTSRTPLLALAVRRGSCSEVQAEPGHRLPHGSSAPSPLSRPPLLPPAAPGLALFPALPPRSAPHQQPGRQARTMSPLRPPPAPSVWLTRMGLAGDWLATILFPFDATPMRVTVET
ncbi:hypothetical protein AOLI_G00165430 [Acnodon oligacanthus]